MADFKASVQFDINDPEMARKLLDLSSQLVVKGEASRVSYGSAGKALIEALMKRPDLVEELLGVDAESHAPSASTSKS